jgi:hypothetical protein
MNAEKLRTILLEPLGGKFSGWDAGEEVLVSQIRDRQCYIDRAEWVKPKVQIMNSLFGVPISKIACPACRGVPQHPDVKGSTGCMKCDFHGTLEGFVEMERLDAV